MKFNNGILIYQILKLFKNGESFIFPIPFINNTYSVTGTHCGSGTGHVLTIGFDKQKNDRIEVYVLGNPSATVSIIAIGRWK